MFKKSLLFIASAATLTSIFSASLAVPVRAATNLIANSSVETNTNSLPDNWMKDGWGTNSPTFSYTNNGQNGTHSLTIQMKSYASGDAKWYFQPVAVTSGHTYSYSDYYKATVQTYLVAQTDDGAGNFNYFQIGSALSTSLTWKKVTGTFTVPANVRTLTVFHLINKNGTLQTDSFDLHEVDQVSVSDNVPNNSLEQVSETSSSKPSGWDVSYWGQNKGVYTYLNSGHTGSHSVRIQMTSYSSGDAKWTYAPQPTTANTKWTFSDYYQANVTSRVVVEITNTDKSQSYIELKNAPSSSAWTKYSDTFTTTADASSFRVFHLLSSLGTLTTDDYSVLPYVPAGFSRALVTLTFDDGFESQYAIAKPLMDQYAFKGTFYITTGFLNSDGFYMTDAQVNDLKNSGNQISDHTVTHPHLTTLSSTQVTNELKNSQTYLKNTFGVSANDFASPFGEVNSSVLATVKTYFRSHRGVVDGYNYKDSFDIYNMKVQNVTNQTSVAQVAAWIQEAAQTKAWLILVYHQFDNQSDTYSSTTADFANQLGVINQSGLPVVTLDQGITEVLPQIGK